MALDMVRAYWQFKLHEDSQDLTAFLCHWGKYHFKWAPMGTSPSGDLLSQAMDDVLQPVHRLLKEVDNLLIHGSNYNEINESLYQLLRRCSITDIYIAPKKIQMGSKVILGGHKFCAEGWAPDPDKLAAIREYPTPLSKDDIRPCLRVVWQMRDWVPELQQATTLLKGALKKGVIFQWSPDMNQEFVQMKEVMSNKLILKPFDMKLKTALFVDSSKLYGVCYMSGQWHDEEEYVLHPDRLILMRCGSVSARTL